MDRDTQDGKSIQLHVYDSEFHARCEAFGTFKEAVARAFMPWQLDRNPDNEFKARLESLSTDFLSFARATTTPLLATRAKLEISQSPEHCLYATYVISGRIVVEQDDTLSLGHKGDLVLFDSVLAAKYIKAGEGQFETLAFRIPKHLLGSENRAIQNAVIPRAKIMRPLASCFEFLSRNFAIASPTELTAVGTACAALLSAAPGYSINHRCDDPFDLISNHRAREMIRFINAHIADRSLSPAAVAEHLGISVRYVHKQFAAYGTTFSNYVNSRRLECIGFDLVSEAGRHHPIGVVAFRWGFNDLSHFVRAFKKKFGCLPREYRSRFQ